MGIGNIKAENRVNLKWTEIEQAQKAYDTTLARIIKIQTAMHKLEEEEADLYSGLSACKAVVDKLLFPPEPERSYAGTD